MVRRNDTSGGEVVFQRWPEYIKVIRETKVELLVTPTLGDDGECRFKVNGKSNLLRWQVLRNTLEPLFFD